MFCFQRKYGEATTIRFPMVKRSSADLAISPDWTPVSGEVLISKDGGADANAGSLPTSAAGRKGKWSLALTAAEMQAAQVEISLIDTSVTKAVEDQYLLIETFGHASAQFEFDFDTGFAITPLSSIVSSGAVSDTDVTLYKATAKPDIVWTITDDTGAAVNLGGAVSWVVTTIANAAAWTSAGTVSGANNNIVTAGYTTANTATPGLYRYELRRTDSGNERVLARGDVIIKQQERE